MVTEIEKFIASKTPEELRAIRSQGGKTVTRKRELSFKLNGLKRKFKKNWRKEDTDFLIECIADPDVSIYNLERLLDDMKGKLSAKDFLNIKMQIHKLTHGEKRNIDMNVHTEIPVTLNIGVDMKNFMPEDEVVDAEFKEVNE